MSREGFSDDHWYAGQPAPGGRFRHNDSVRVTAGEHGGKFGAIIYFQTWGRELEYLVELGSGEGDLWFSDSSLAPAE